MSIYNKIQTFWNDVWVDEEDKKLRKMDDNFSPRVKDVISFSKEEALRLGHDYIGTEHLMLGILRDGGGKAITILNAIAVDLENLRRKVEILNPACTCLPNLVWKTNRPQSNQPNQKKCAQEQNYQ